MEILRISRTQEVENEQNCSALSFSASSLIDYSIEQQPTWFTSSSTDSSLTISVSDNATGPQISSNPPTWPDRAAGITLVQEESGNEINIGLFQSGKGYKEGYMLSGEPEYKHNVSASEVYVDVTWREVKCWQSDTDTGGTWTPFDDLPTYTYTKTVSLSGGMNSSSSMTSVSEFSFVSEHGVTVSGTVTQAENRASTAITHFIDSSASPDKIFYGGIFGDQQEALIWTSSTTISAISITYTPVVTAIWEVYDDELPSSAVMETRVCEYVRPKLTLSDYLSDNHTIEEYMSDHYQGFDFEDSERGAEYGPVSRMARQESLGLSVYHSYYYYPRYIIRDFVCYVKFKEKDSNGNFIEPTYTNGFGVSVDTAIICNSDYYGTTKPSPLIFYQQTSVGTTPTGSTAATMDNSPTVVYWPTDGVSNFTYQWNRKYFYSYPEGNIVEMEPNATIFTGGGTSTTADTTLANAYFRVSSNEFTNSADFDYDIEATDTDGNVISPVSGKTMDARNVEELYQSMEWYPCHMGGDDDEPNTRYVIFTITRKPKTTP